MKKHSKFLLFSYLLLLFCSPPPKNTAYIAEPNKNIFDTTLTALYIPLEKIVLSVVQDKDLATLKKSNPLYLFAKKPAVSHPSIKNDSFFIEMANELALYEVSQHYKTIKYTTDTSDSVQDDQQSPQLQIHWSRLAGDTVTFEKARSSAKKIAKRYGVDLVIVPYACSLIETETQTKAWRDNKYGKYYEKPSTVDAKALLHMQIWDKNGILQYERKGMGISRRPVLYEALKKNQPENQSLADYSKNIFAPTLIRSLGQACRNAFAGR